jgi:hypothetical protein
MIERMMYQRIQSDRLSHSIDMKAQTATTAAHPIRKRYCMALVFHDKSLKFTFRENMGSSEIIIMSVARDNTTRQIDNIG